MNEIIQFSIIAIPIIIGVVSGLNKKINDLFNVETRLTKELVTVMICLASVLYYVLMIKTLEVQLMAVMLVINYFGASGIYQFIPTKEVEAPIIETVDMSEGE